METRNFELRSVKEDRTVEGIAVPYGDTIDLGGVYERFERGAFGDPTNVKLFYDHKEPIGLVEKTEDTEEGFVIRARISQTPRGDEVYTLLRDGVLNKFSVGFMPVEDRMDDDVIVRTKADLKEVSVVAFPAYENAAVSQVRTAETTNNIQEENSTMSNETNKSQEVEELRADFENLERKVSMLGTVSEPKNAAPQFRSFGEYVKAVAGADGDKEATKLARAYTGLTTADSVVKDGWVGSAVRLVQDNRLIVNAFSKGQLPAEGNNVEYAVLSTNTHAIAVQAAEGDDLTYGEVTLDTATAPVKTYGGYAQLTRQAIERSSVNILDTNFQAMSISYAKATNAAARAALVAASGTNTATLAANTVAGWSGLLIDAAADLDVEGLSPEFIIVSSDVFKTIGTLTATDGRTALAYGGTGVNTIGSVSGARLTASLDGVPVYADPSLAANSCYIANGIALKTFESAGAPFQLQDENTINLSKTFSIYGYMAVAVQHAKAIVKCDVDLTP
ncbi:HK97 family phage prohead protease [Streptomyces turgidiscabies]|uniref:HK97 family phage prohead protease n=1 Tax=Streptomyces turgidiscabies TaxID=85558 RepID=UPI0038F61C93